MNRLTVPDNTRYDLREYGRRRRSRWRRQSPLREPILQAVGRDEGADWLYRQILSKGVEGMLVADRAACSGPTVNRTRLKMLLMGQAVGFAAALAIRDDTHENERNDSQ